jgi:hypothetical protein
MLESLRGLQLALAVAEVDAIRSVIGAAKASAVGTTLFRDQSGATRSSIHEVLRGTSGQLIANGAAYWLENGTRPASSMRTVPMRINGATIFRRFIHPGIAARPFMAKARDVGEQMASVAGDLYANQAIAAFNAR